MSRDVFGKGDKYIDNNVTMMYRARYQDISARYHIPGPGVSFVYLTVYVFIKLGISHVICRSRNPVTTAKISIQNCAVDLFKSSLFFLLYEL